VPAAVQAPGVAAFGGTATPSRDRQSGFLAALDPATGHVRWQVRIARPMIGGALATAADLVFSGADDGYLYVFDARSGAILWRADVGLGFGAAPISYMVNGIQYLAVAAGGSAEAPLTKARTGALLVAFRLGGKKEPCKQIAVCV
jgi:glucose dehydrogenase